MLIFLLSILLLVYLINGMVAITAIVSPARCDAAASPLPDVTVLIAARNEAESLPALFDSLHALDYPTERLQILLVNDASTDRTASVMEAFCSEKPSAVCMHLETNHGKAVALHKLSELATGELLVFTDADCTVPAEWLLQHVKAHQDGANMCAGQVHINRDLSMTILGLWQAIDWKRFCIAGHAWNIHGVNLSVFGNNLSINRDDYQQIGGFESASSSITEDYALMHNLLLLKDKSLKFLSPACAPVTTQAESDLNTFLKQRRRWAQGARGRSLPATLIIGVQFIMPWLSLLLIVTGRPLAGLTMLMGFTVSEYTINSRLSSAKSFKTWFAGFTFPLFFMFYTTAVLPGFWARKSNFWKADESDNES